MELSQTDYNNDNYEDDIVPTGRFDDIFDNKYTGSGEMFDKYEKIVIGWMDFIDGIDDDNIDGGDDSLSESSSEDSDERIVINNGLSDFDNDSDESEVYGKGLSDFDKEPEEPEEPEKSEESKESKESEVSGNGLSDFDKESALLDFDDTQSDLIGQSALTDF